MPWFSDLELHKARKIHQCSWCGGHIQSGETYAKFVSTYDGFQVVKMHTECQSASERYDEEEWQLWNCRGLTPAERDTMEHCDTCQRLEYREHVNDGLCRDCRTTEVSNDTPTRT